MFADLIKNVFLRGFLRCSRAAVSPMVALMLVPILGATALTVDVGYWYYKQRDMQSAADSAAIAGAQTPDENASDPSYDGTNDNYIKIAKGTAAKYGYLDGQNTVSVAVSRVTCPSGVAGCTQVVIGYTSPLVFSPIVGFRGNKNGAQGVAAVAVAGDQAGSSGGYCLTALNNTPGAQGIRANGVPFANLNGCTIFSNSDLNCTGGNLGAGQAIAAGNSSNCGTTQISHAPQIQDPYGPAPGSNQRQYIPDTSDTCKSGYPQATRQGNKYTVAADHQLVGSYDWTGNKIFCGDIQLSGDVTLTGKQTTVVIDNGWLDMNGHTFKTADGASATLVFTGSDGYNHYPTSTESNSGTIDIKGSVGGDWDGFAIFQDPNLNSIVDIADAGNAPAYNVSGIIYLPKANITLKGVINKSGTGYSCTPIIAWTIDVRGTGDIFKPGAMQDCTDPNIPGATTTVHKWLVQ